MSEYNNELLPSEIVGMYIEGEISILEMYSLIHGSTGITLSIDRLCELYELIAAQRETGG